MMTHSIDLTGSLIRGYHFREALGQGAFGTVYRAERQTLGTDVAIKVIHPDMGLSSVFLQRFEREARIISRLKHPFITPLYDYWRDADGAYIVLNYYKGGSLRKQLDQAPLSLEDTLNTLNTIASALDYTHRHGIIHRGVEPSNILYDTEGNAFLGDFGFAKDLSLSNQLTQTGNIIGPINYCSPEQMRVEPLNPQSDIFSLGITLYEMLSGEHPFPNTSTAQCAAHLMNDPLPRLEFDFVNDAMNAVIQKATAKKPTERYYAALEVAAAFREAFAGDEPQIEELTARELEALQHLADGLNNREIADAMFIQRPTVNWYLRRIYPKLKVNNRAQAIVIANQHGLIFRELENESDEENTKPELLKTELKRHNLPDITGAFIGRKQELADIDRVLSDPKARLVTILAPGGMGKSALAIEVARQQFDNFRDGVYLVELAPLDDVQHIPSQIAEALNYQFQQGDEPLQQILNYLRYKQLLLVLDNFEHLLDGSPIVSQILNHAPEVQIIVTSRQRLNLRSETVFSISGLGYPVTANGLKDHEASDLFLQEMQRVQPDFELNETTASAIIHICQMVEGMPLALILASAWGDMLSVAEIADELEKGLDFLSVEMPDIPHRHWDMRAMLQTTWERLSEPEQDAFMKMSIFQGGCTREAAEQVTGANLRTLTSLTNKALLKRDTKTGRFSIHELLRQYAAEQLHAQDLLEITQESHFEYYSQSLIDSYPQLIGLEVLDAVDQIEVDFKNHMEAWEYAVNQGRIDCIREMILSFSEFTQYRFSWGWYETISVAIQKLKPEFGEQPEFAMLLWFKTVYKSPIYFSSTVGDDDVIMLLEQAVNLVDSHQNMTLDKAIFLNNLAGAYINKRRSIDAWQVLEKAERLAHKLNDRLLIADLNHKKGYILGLDGKHESAIAHYRSALHTRRELGCQQRILDTRANLANYNYFLGHHKKAIAAYREELIPMYRVFSNRFRLGNILNNLATFLGNSGQWQEALEYREEATNLCRDLDYRLGLIFNLTRLAALLWTAEQPLTARTYLVEAEELIPLAQQQNPGYKPYELAFYTHYFASDHLLAKAAFIKWIAKASFRIFMDDWLTIRLAVLCLSHTSDEELSVVLMAAIRNHPLSPRDYDNRDEYQDWLSRMKAVLGQDGFEAAWERGSAMSRSELEQFLADSFDEA